MRIALVSRQQFMDQMSKTSPEYRWVLQMPLTNFYTTLTNVLFLVKDDITVIKFQDEQELTMASIMQAFADAKGK